MRLPARGQPSPDPAQPHVSLEPRCCVCVGGGRWQLGVQWPLFWCLSGEGEQRRGRRALGRGRTMPTSGHRQLSRQTSSSRLPPPPTAARPHCGLDAPQFHPHGLSGNCCRSL